jgi:glycosyltransferase involved in cell wall biosynthesis
MFEPLQLMILHDYFDAPEGGGRLCLTLARALRADLAYAYRLKKHPYFKNDQELGKEFEISSPSAVRGWKQLKVIRAFSNKTQFLKNYPLVFFSGFYSVCATANHQSGKNIYYCHTPPRYMYDLKNMIMGQTGWFGRMILKQFISYYRPIYEDALSKMDLVITNSKNVQTRIKRYLRTNSVVVYPPCDTKKFMFLGQNDFYLSTARLDPLKRVDQIVQAFLKLPDKNLIVVSGGTDVKRIQRLAGEAKNIKILGWVDEEKLLNLIGRCIATIYVPIDEDFGMSPVESMAAGKPVIGVAEGGLLESVVHDETGVLLNPDFTSDDLAQAVNKMSAKKAISMRNRCQRQALGFDSAIFVKKMHDLLFFKSCCQATPDTDQNRRDPFVKL